MNDENRNDELVKKETTTLTTRQSFKLPESIDDFGIEDLKLSNLLICQAQSNKAIDAGIQPGMIYDSITLEGYSKLEIIMFYKFDTRILFGEDVGDPVRCYSPDAKHPSAPIPIHDNCVHCPEHIRSIEVIKEKGGNKYGDCNRTFNFACIPLNAEAGSEQDFPFLVPMQRSNAVVAKNLINIAFRKRQELFITSRILSTIEIKGDKGRYYNYLTKDSGNIDEQNIERARYWLSFLKEMQKAQRLIIDFEGEPKEDVPF